MWRQPLKWNRRAEKTGVREKVFCASIADVFEEWTGPIVDHNGHRMWIARDGNGLPIPETPQGSFANCRPMTMDDARDRLFRLIDSTPNLTWQLLTKRPENILKMWPVEQCCDCYGAEQRGISCGTCGNTGHHHYRRGNVWLGTSISDQETADEWIPRLLPACDLSPVLFLSAEPLLGPVDLRLEEQSHAERIGQVIMGGESGPGARQCEVEWIRSIVKQYRKAGVPVFTKQLGAHVIDRDTTAAHSCPEEECWPAGTKTNIHRVLLKDSKGGELDEWPEGLRVRQFPKISLAATAPILP
jgi:hypothetical protein